MLCDEAEAKGIEAQIDEEVDVLDPLRFVGPEYLANRFEYIETGSLRLPESDRLHTSVGTLARKLEVPCYEATYGNSNIPRYRNFSPSQS